MEVELEKTRRNAGLFCFTLNFGGLVMGAAQVQDQVQKGKFRGVVGILPGLFMRFHREAKRRTWITDDDEGGDAAHRRQQIGRGGSSESRVFGPRRCSENWGVASPWELTAPSIGGSEQRARGFRVWETVFV